MAFSPLAFAKEAEQISQKNLRLYLQEFGLDRKSTLGEYWQKSKAYYPAFVYNDLQKYVAENKNKLMPEFILSSAKGSDGRDIPVISINQNGKTNTLQFFGEKKKWLKFNNVFLSEDDLKNPVAAIARIEASDLRIKKEYDKLRDEQRKKTKVPAVSKADAKRHLQQAQDLARFQGFPRITPVLWKSMTKQQRAGFIVKMRLLRESALKVLALNPTKAKKTAALERSVIEVFYRNIFGEEALAETQDGAQANKARSAAKMDVKLRGQRIVTQQGAIVEVPYTAPTCVVAGYIGAYGKVDNVNGPNRPGCSVDVAIASYKSSPSLKFVQEANDTCAAEKPNTVACNPILYSYPKGKEICISKTEAQFQVATLFDGPCDRASRLSSSPDVIKFATKDYSDIQPEARRHEIIEQDQKKQDYQMTKDFLDGMLLKRDPISKLLFDKGEWSLDLDNKLVEIQSQFEEEIGRATESCRNSIVAGTNESYQKLACDQLHRRWLFTEREIAKLRSKACDPDARYVGTYDKDELSTSDEASTLAKTAINKKYIDPKGTNLCECVNVKVNACDQPGADCLTAEKKIQTNKKVSFGEKCSPAIEIPSGAVKGVDAMDLKCPAGMNGSLNDENQKMCTCENGMARMTQEEAFQPHTIDQLESICAPEKAKSCDKENVSGNFDYEKCECKTGTLEDENEPGFVTKLLHLKSEKKAAKWVCKESNLPLWPLLLLLPFFLRSKKKVVPPAVCSLTCTGSTQLNKEQCLCEPASPPPSCAPMIGTPPSCSCPISNNCSAVNQKYNMVNCTCDTIALCADNSQPPGGNMALCPTCDGGIPKTTSGCPAKNEGGSGNNTCANPPCSGGVPVTQ
jgi:hypothetical protein